MSRDAGINAEDDRRFVQVIDLHTGHPAEVERLLRQWQACSSTREHVSAVRVGHDPGDEGHLVLQVEYDAVPAPREDEPSVGEPACAAEAIAVVGLLDQPPRFRSPVGSVSAV